MNKRTISFFLGSVLVGLTLFLIPFCSKRVLSIPNNVNHAALYDKSQPQMKVEACLVCHGTKGIHPLPKRHPASHQCLFCHTLQS